jgi:multisubunit Na+/H+ antiporter MnhC subunit
MYRMDEKAALEIIIKICGLVLMLSGLIMLFSSSTIMLIMGIVLAGVGWFLLKIFKPGEK